MKIRGHITAVEDHGDNLRIVGQGEAGSDALWRDMNRFEFKVASIERNRRAFYLGRHVTITIEPRGRS